MEDLCTLAQIHPDEFSTHAVSFALLALALRDAHKAGNNLDREAFHRAADLALTLFTEERQRFESVDTSAPLLDRLYLKAFVPEEAEEDAEAAALSIARRFHAEVLRLLYLRTAAAENAAVGYSEVPHSH